jgi:hypothetical protein
MAIADVIGPRKASFGRIIIEFSLDLYAGASAAGCRPAAVSVQPKLAEHQIANYGGRYPVCPIGRMIRRMTTKQIEDAPQSG